MSREATIIGLEFLFRHDHCYLGGDRRGSYRIIPHRIVRRTPKRIFVERDEHSVSRSERVPHRPRRREVPTVSLDRSMLEGEGKVLCRTLGIFGCIFTADRSPLDMDTLKGRC